MRGEIPLCMRCCFCFPLRYGLITWGFFKLAFTIFAIVMLSFNLDDLVVSKRRLIERQLLTTTSPTTLDEPSSTLHNKSTTFDKPSSTLHNSSSTVEKPSSTLNNTSKTFDKPSSTLNKTSSTFENSSLTVNNSSTMLNNSSSTNNNSSSTESTDDHEEYKEDPTVFDDGIIVISVMLAFFVIDFIITTIFIIGGFKKNVIFLRVFYYYSIVVWILSLILFLVAFGFCIKMYIWLNSRWPIKYIILDNMLQMATFFFVLVMQTYILLLIRSEINKLRRSCQYSFMNNAAAAEAEVNMIENVTDNTDVEIS